MHQKRFLEYSINVNFLESQMLLGIPQSIDRFVCLFVCVGPWKSTFDLKPKSQGLGVLVVVVVDPFAT